MEINGVRSRGDFGRPKPLSSSPESLHFVDVNVAAGYTKKGLESECTSKLVPRIQAFFLARFTGAITQSVIGLPLGCVVAPAGERRFASAKRAGEAPQQNGGTDAPRTKAAVRGAVLRGFAKQTEKDGEDHGIELARIPEILRLFHKTAATKPQPTSNTKRRFFCTFLTQESTVLPSFPAPPLTAASRAAPQSFSPSARQPHASGPSAPHCARKRG